MTQLTKKQMIREGLPHLYGWPWYEWAWQFFESTNRINLLCAANQISKSSTQIRKCIDWCTAPAKWKKLWPLNPIPRNIWYLYPDSKVATIEVESKWVPEFLPRPPFDNHPVFGWKIIYGDKRKIEAIKFNSGVTLHFKTYMQNPISLQSSTVHAIFCDEELPEHLYSELQFRLTAPEGHFHMVFTATLNQLMWWRAMEGSGREEVFPDALKLQISMYDCMRYRDGTQGPFNEERIANIKAACKSQNEIKRRVYGRFVADSGLKYPAFDPNRHFVQPFELDPGKWHFYGAVDPGVGGTGHPAGMGIIAVDRDYRKAYVCRGRRMDGMETSSSDILDEFIKMRGGLTLRQQIYDYANKDFQIVATRAGEPFIMAEKGHELGEDIVNTLFKNDMLFIFDTPELRKLGQELVTVTLDQPKRKAKDDFIDGALRYPCAKIPWDWTAIRGVELPKEPEERPLTQEEYEQYVDEQRRGKYGKQEDGDRKKSAEWREWREEVGFWNERYGS